MPVDVHLNFLPPTVPDITKLHILEATTANGIYSEIEVVTAVGSYPNYITRYTTSMANSLSDWFRIQWEDSKGALTELSESVQGGTESLLSQITEMVLLRDPALNENIVAQEAAAAIEMVFRVSNPFSLPAGYGTYSQRIGLVYMIMARSYISTVVRQSQSDSYQAGLVSQKASSSTKVTTDTIRWLLDQANALLGTGYTLVMLLEDIDPTGIGAASSIEWDQSRLLLSIE
jgi:hypothetical protein